MRHKNDRLSCFLKLIEFAVTFRLEKNISHAQSLIYDQDIRLHIDSHRECQPREHTAGIGLHRLMDKLSDLRKGDDVIQFPPHLFICKPHHSPVEENILQPCIFHIEPGSQFQQGADFSINLHRAAGRRQNAGDDL